MRAIRRVLRYFVPFAIVFCAKFLFLAAEDLTAEKKQGADPVSWLESDQSGFRLLGALGRLSRDPCSSEVADVASDSSTTVTMQHCDEGADLEGFAWQFAEPCDRPWHE